MECGGGGGGGWDSALGEGRKQEGNGDEDIIVIRGLFVCSDVHFVNC